MDTYTPAYPKSTYKKPHVKVQKIKMQEHRECWHCHTTLTLEAHHCMGGANRPLSERYGLKVYLCHEHHTGGTGVHFNKILMDKLRREAQKRFEQIYSREEFIRLFGRNYNV